MGPDGYLQTKGVALQERNVKLGEPTIIEQAVSKPSLCPMGRHPHPSSLLTASTTLRNGPSEQGLEFLAYVVGVCKGAQGRLPLQTVSGRTLTAARPGSFHCNISNVP